MSHQVHGRSGTPKRRWFAGALASFLPLAGLAFSMSGARADAGDPPGTIRTIAGSTQNFAQGGFRGDGGPALQAQLYNPRAFVFAPNGDLYIADSLNERLRKIDTQGTITTVAGSPVADANGNPTPCIYSSTQNCGDGGPAIKAGFNEPHGVSIDSKGNLYISDSQNNRIRKIDTTGTITTFAGTGVKTTPPGDNVAVATAGIQDPKQQMILNDVLYFCDTSHNMIRSIDLKANPLIVKTVAGTIQSKRFGGDGGPANRANLNSPKGMFIQSDGTIYISDTDNNLVRKITPDGIIQTIAGDAAAAAQASGSTTGSTTLTGDSAGDGGPAVNAHLNGPRGIIADAAGNVFVAETLGARIRRIDPQGNISTIGGTGVENGRGAVVGDPGPTPALQAQFNWPHDLLLQNGNLYVADQKNDRIRVIFDAAHAPGSNVGPSTPGGSPGGPQPGPGVTPGGSGQSGYWMLGSDGKVYAFGDAHSLGDPSAALPAGAKAVHIEPTPTAKGYWIVDDAGHVYAYGDAVPAGGATPSQLAPGEKVTSLSPTPSGKGYWLFSTKGRVFTFGDAKSFGDLAGKNLNGAVASSVATPSGNGYYMVASDGGVFAFGDAKFRGSMGATKLNQPVQSLVPTRDGGGYWLVASDGGIFAFGNGPFKGSMGATKLNRPVVGMVRYGDGYLMVGADGGIFDFSNRPFAGSLGATPPAHPIVFAATLDS
jgi:sugar lactone lactonase YvrE